jgi:prevent-host-death family protein
MFLPSRTGHTAVFADSLPRLSIQEGSHAEIHCQSAPGVLFWSKQIDLTGEERMTSFGIYEAKTHLPQLVERVAHGEEILITRHGKAVALLTAPPKEDGLDVREIIRRMRELRKGVTLGPDLTIRQMIDEGRRF